MIPIVRTRIEPENIHTLWIDESENCLKIYGPNGWEPISGISKEDLEKLNNALDAIESITGESKSDAIDTLDEIKKFLEDFKDNQNLKEYITKELDAVIEEIKETMGEAVEAITEEELNNILN